MNVEEAIQVTTTTVKNLFGGVNHRLEEIDTNDGGFEIAVSYREQYPARLIVGPWDRLQTESHRRMPYPRGGISICFRLSCVTELEIAGVKDGRAGWEFASLLCPGR